MVDKIKAEQLFSELKDKTLFDVRTPAEFEKGHIPGAVNLPLFSNEERAVVGTIYKQNSPEKALLQGLEFVGPKMRTFVETAHKLAPNKSVIVHCWRGGQRSGSMGWLLNMANFQVATLEGGYKAFRIHSREVLEKHKHQFIILGGGTGSGKTEILQELSALGEQVLDLEALAHHKGSAFGALGQDDQPTVEQFENDLFAAINQLDTSKRIWLENENQAIGRVYLPQGFRLKMDHSPIINLQIPLDCRIDRLVKEYAQFPKEALVSSFTKIKKRLGGLNLKLALEALENDDFREAASIALQYYDKSYNYVLSKRPESSIFNLALAEDMPGKTAEDLVKLIKKIDNGI
jgi:tRNA 2-selenouridine synthase